MKDVLSLFAARQWSHGCRLNNALPSNCCCFCSRNTVFQQPKCYHSGCNPGSAYSPVSFSVSQSLSPSTLGMGTDSNLTECVLRILSPSCKHRGIGDCERRPLIFGEIVRQTKWSLDGLSSPCKTATACREPSSTAMVRLCRTARQDTCQWRRWPRRCAAVARMSKGKMEC